MSWMIREMLKQDCKQVQALAIKSWHATYKGIIPIAVKNKFLDRAYHPIMLEKRRTQSLFLVAISNVSTIVGFANFSHVKKDKSAELYAIMLTMHTKEMG